MSCQREETRSLSVHSSFNWSDHISSLACRIKIAHAWDGEVAVMKSTVQSTVLNYSDDCAHCLGRLGQIHENNEVKEYKMLCYCDGNGNGIQRES